jgi:hypothetical protein
MHFSTLITATASLFSLALALPANDGLAACHCTTALQRLFCGSDDVHLAGDCNPSIVYLCPGPIGIQAIVFEDCGSRGLNCDRGIVGPPDGSSIMGGVIGEVAWAHYQELAVPSAAQIATRTDSLIGECRCITVGGGKFCGFNGKHLYGICDPGFVYLCPEPFSSPAIPFGFCSLEGKSCELGNIESPGLGKGEAHCGDQIVPTKR